MFVNELGYAGAAILLYMAVSLSTEMTLKSFQGFLVVSFANLPGLFKKVCNACHILI